MLYVNLMSSKKVVIGVITSPIVVWKSLPNFINPFAAKIY